MPILAIISIVPRGCVLARSSAGSSSLGPPISIRRKQHHGCFRFFPARPAYPTWCDRRRRQCADRSGSSDRGTTGRSFRNICGRTFFRSGAIRCRRDQTQHTAGLSGRSDHDRRGSQPSGWHRRGFRQTIKGPGLFIAQFIDADPCFGTPAEFAKQIDLEIRK